MYKIAVVDDDESILGLYEAILSDRYQLTLCSDSKAFLQHVKNDPPDLLIVDLMMPEMNGLILIGKLKEFCDIPVIAVSGTKDSKLTAGAMYQSQAFLAKPFQSLELIQVIEDCLKTDSL